MGRRLLIIVFALMAAAVGAEAAGAVGDAVAAGDLDSWLVAGYDLLKLTVAVAFTVFVVTRAPARERTRDPIAYLACGAAILPAVLRAPSESASTGLVLAGELVALLGCAWMLVAALALGRCFGVLPEARGLVTHGPYRLVRHPLYLGEFAAMGGLLLASPVAPQPGGRRRLRRRPAHAHAARGARAHEGVPRVQRTTPRATPRVIPRLPRSAGCGAHARGVAAALGVRRARHHDGRVRADPGDDRAGGRGRPQPARDGRREPPDAGRPGVLRRQRCVLPRRLHAPGSLVRRRLAQSDPERGAVIVMVAVWLPILVLIAAFVVDIANWFVHRRHLQMQADAAALAAAGDWAFPGCSDAAIEARARQYGGFTLNSQIGGTPTSRVHLLMNSRTWHGQTSPVDSTVDTDGPCAGAMVDVKLTETDLPWFLKVTKIVPFINAHARVSIFQADTISGAAAGGSARPASGASAGGVRRRERLHGRPVPRARPARSRAGGRGLLALGQLGESGVTHGAVEQDRSAAGAERLAQRSDGLFLSARPVLRRRGTGGLLHIRGWQDARDRASHAGPEVRAMRGSSTGPARGRTSPPTRRAAPSGSRPSSTSAATTRWATSTPG